MLNCSSINRLASKTGLLKRDLFASRYTGEAAPRTDEECAAPVPGASLPSALYPPQLRTLTQETTFGNLAQL